MLTSMNHANQERCYRQACETLPRISALFAKGLQMPQEAGCLPDLKEHQWTTLPRLIHLTSYTDKQPGAGPCAEEHSFIAQFLPNVQGRKHQHERQHRIVNALIAGISHHSNNILMGVWGNVSLIKLQVEAAHPSFCVLERLEKIIQDGSYLLHLILGCAGERRLDAKRIRIKQLMNEFRQYVSEPVSITELEESFRIDGRCQDPRIIAASSARVLEILLNGIETFQHTVVMENLDKPRILQRSGIIAALLKKGRMLTSKLIWYARDDNPQKKRVSVESLVRRQVRRLKVRYPNVAFFYHRTPHLPWVKVNPDHIGWVIGELIENGCRRMASEGRLSVSVNPLFADAPGERCGVHGSYDYLVVTVKDNGPGMSRKCQKRILEPFFSFQPDNGDDLKKGQLGLGLSAADGILTSHGGFLQFQSKQGQGSCFKIYLPPCRHDDE